MAHLSLKRWPRLLARTALAGAMLVLAAAFSAAVVLRLLSPGVTAPFLDEAGDVVEGSIATTERVRLGGFEQFVLTRGRNRDHPVLLVLHGGPGDAEASLFQYYNRELEDHFVVAHWDQRGAGRSFSTGIPLETMTVEQLVSDAHELAKLLATRFRRDRILVMGHSWGSYLGLRLVHAHPGLFAAFVGVGQVADQVASEGRSFEWVLHEAQTRGETSAVRALASIGPPIHGRYRHGLTGLGVQRRWVREFGGAARGRGNLGVLWAFIWPTVVFPEYRIVDKLRYLEAEAFSMALLEEPMLDDSPAATMLDFELPIFVLQGRHDHQTEFEVARAYFERIQAPHKELVVFEDAAHLVPFEQPEKFLRVMLERVRPWAQADRSFRAALPSSR